jgi:hypothetical protein
MRRPVRLLVPLALVLALPTPASATHNQDEHSTNMEMLFSMAKPGVGRGTGTGNVHSDLAMWEDVAYAGNYVGFRAFDISNAAAPVLLADFPCHGNQNDVSVWDNLLFLSIDRPQTSPECTSVNTPSGVTGFEGIRIIDVSNPSAPRFVKGVPTDCGSHTNTLVPDVKNGRVLLYVASYPTSFRGPTPYGTQCSLSNPGHDKISIVEVPLAAPQNARVAATPGPLGLADILGVPGQRGCHDIAVFLPRKIAAGACWAEGVLFDISDPMNPRVSARLVNPAIDTCARRPASPPAEPLCLWHSAAFTWDGKYAIFGDEAGGGDSPECERYDPMTRGALWIHKVATPTHPISFFKIARFQARSCLAHNFNVVPLNGRYIVSSAWNDGGTVLVDWTNPRGPFELGYYDAVLPLLPPAGVVGSVGPWSSYWHNDFILVNDRDRGFDVLRFKAAWTRSAFGFHHQNAQSQETTIGCRARATGRLEARRRSTLVVTVKAVGAAPLVRRQPVARATVRLRGPGLLWSRVTNRRGVARLTFRPARAGVVRVDVPTAPNMAGCKTQRRVRP